MHTILRYMDCQNKEKVQIYMFLFNFYRMHNTHLHLLSCGKYLNFEIGQGNKQQAIQL